MDFQEIAILFEKLENTPKRLKKILILRDFLLKDKKIGALLFDIISGNFQRDIEKKTIGISLKTIFSVAGFLSKTSSVQIEKKFNKVGDVGEVMREALKQKHQESLFKKKLTISVIIKALKEISVNTGTNSNKVKREILSNLFLSTQTSLENKFLARLLIDDLRIGVSQGVLKEACINAYFPQIVGIHNVCSKCLRVNLNLKNCYSCNTALDLKKQKEIISKKYGVVELETPKNETSLKEYDINYEIDAIGFALRRDREKYFLKSQNPRKIYNTFLKSFEKKYNLINSFKKILKELDESLSNILKFNIVIGNPIRSMLAPATHSIGEAFNVTGKPALIDFKYDGLRVQIHNYMGKVKLFSRNLDDITKQFPEVVEFICDNFSDLIFVIDSECIGYDFNKMRFLPFQTLSRRILAKDFSQVSHINVVVRAFDIMFLNNNVLIDEPYLKRREILEGLFLNRDLRQRLNFNDEKLL